mgnify:FL=1
MAQITDVKEQCIMNDKKSFFDKERAVDFIKSHIMYLILIVIILVFKKQS